MIIILEAIFGILLVQFASSYQEPNKNESSKTHVPKVYPLHTFKLNNASRFEYDDKEIVLAGATVHYFRIPRDHWEHRLKMLAASGLNTLFTAIDWSSHEPYEGEFKFTGEKDFVYFIRIAEELGLKVVLRPGPFIGEQRDLGGYPSWLLWQGGQPDLTLNGQNFRHSLARYFRELLPRIKPLLADHGGPIIMLEITQEVADNEWLMRIFRKRLGRHITYSIFREDRVQRSVQATVSTDDGWRQAPLVTFSNTWSEIWPNAYGDTGVRYAEMMETLLANTSISIGAFHAGTDFGYKAGAVLKEDKLISYSIGNVDSLIGEDGSVGPVYPMVQTMASSMFGCDMPRPLPQPPTMALGSVMLTPIGSLLDMKLLKRLHQSSITQKSAPTFEDLHQGDGFVLYETRVKHNYTEADLYLYTVRDRAQVYLNSQLIGSVVRGCNENASLSLGQVHEGDMLMIFVENLGRPYWGTESPKRSRKGVGLFSMSPGLAVDSPVLINMDELTDWTAYGLPFDSSLSLPHIVNEGLRAEWEGEESTPFLAGSAFLILEQRDELADTFLDMRGWGRGIVMFNGFNLGRYSPDLGTRKGLLVPKSLLRVNGDLNYLLVLELDRVPSIKHLSFRLDLLGCHWVPMCNVGLGLMFVLLSLVAIMFLGRDAKGWMAKRGAAKVAI